MRINAGVLVPTGGSYARMGDSFLEGLRMGLTQAGVSMSLSIRPVARGCDGAYTAAAELAGSGVDVVVAGITAPVARLLTPVFTEAQVPLVVAGVGGHVLDPAAKSPLVIHNTLQYWQASHALGRWAVQRMARRAFVASSFADSGYDTIFAFTQGFESAGGSVVGKYVTHRDPKNAGLNELFAQIRDANPGLVFANYSGAARTEFLRAYAGSGLRVPLAGTSFLAEDFGDKSLGRFADRIRTCASWTHADPSPQNQAFVDAYARLTGRHADVFAVLGHDTAALLVAGFGNADRNHVARNRLAEALVGQAVQSPRGTLRIDPATNSIAGPLFIRQVRAASGPVRQYVNVKAAAVPTLGALPSLEAADRSGYFNEVLCA
jgi:branched-chain amino acid transport system substrate-binding protein